MQNQQQTSTEPTQKPAKPVDENLGILVQDHIRIFDPKTQQMHYRGRG
jgi:hypothetical protein